MNCPKHRWDALWIWIMIIQISFDRHVLAYCDLHAARHEEAAFLQEIYDCLNMEEKSLAVHNWYRNDAVICDFTGIQCDADGLVTVVDLSSKGLSGTLPSSWAPLSRLERLSLRNNDIGGLLPTEIPSTLIHFNVNRNRLSGTIPNFQFLNPNGISRHYGGISQLERLILSDNFIEGCIPASICNLLYLRALNLSRNPFLEGTLPSCLVSLTNLRGLQVQGTHLIGPLVPQDDFCKVLGQDGSSTSSTQEGYCERFEFCLDGYREIHFDQDGEDVIRCDACGIASNVLSSPTCQWIYEPPSSSPTVPSFDPSLAPTMAPTIKISEPPSRIPSKTPSVFPSVSPSLFPSMFPITEYPSFYPTVEPSISLSRLPTASSILPLSHVPTLPWNHPTSVSNDQASDMPSVVFLDNGNNDSPSTQVDGVQSQGDTEESSRSALYSKEIFVPVFVLLCLISFGALAMTVPSLWERTWWKRRSRAFGSLEKAASGSYDDEYDKDQDEIVFCRENCYGVTGGLDELLENGWGSASHCDCDCGCHIPSLPSFTTTEPIPSPENRPIISRPCIVQPQTRAANPKVRFLLLAKSSSSTTSEGHPVKASEEEDRSCFERCERTDSDGDFGMELDDKRSNLDCCPEQTKPPDPTKAYPAFSSLFCAPVCLPMPQAQGTRSTGKTSGATPGAQKFGENDAAWTMPGSRPRSTWPPENSFRPSIPADSSSLSSTTPALNPFGCTLIPRSSVLTRRFPIKPCTNQMDEDAAIAEYARKYLPEEAASIQPPVQEVDCTTEPDVSFSWSMSQDQPVSMSNVEPFDGSQSSRGVEAFSSFRPPRFYKNPVVDPDTTTPVTNNKRSAPYMKWMEDHPVLGIRPPPVDPLHCDEEYEVEFFDVPMEEAQQRSLRLATNDTIAF